MSLPDCHGEVAKERNAAPKIALESHWIGHCGFVARLLRQHSGVVGVPDIKHRFRVRPACLPCSAHSHWRHTDSRKSRRHYRGAVHMRRSGIGGGGGGWRCEEWSGSTQPTTRQTASAIPSLVRAPRHSSTIASQSMPSPTCASMSATRILVPRNTGFPWQIPGSMTMYLPRTFARTVASQEQYQVFLHLPRKIYAWHIRW